MSAIARSWCASDVCCWPLKRKTSPEVGLGFRRRLDLAGGPKPIGGLLQLRDPLRPQPGEGSPPLQQQARVVGIVLGPELERPGVERRCGFE